MHNSATKIIISIEESGHCYSGGHLDFTDIRKSSANKVWFT